MILERKSSDSTVHSTYEAAMDEEDVAIIRRLGPTENPCWMVREGGVSEIPSITIEELDRFFEQELR